MHVGGQGLGPGADVVERVVGAGRRVVEENQGADAAGLRQRDRVLDGGVAVVDGDRPLTLEELGVVQEHVDTLEHGAQSSETPASGAWSGR